MLAVICTVDEYALNTEIELVSGSLVLSDIRTSFFTAS